MYILIFSPFSQSVLINRVSTHSLLLCEAKHWQVVSHQTVGHYFLQIPKKEK
jgi:hypothetical protein